MRGPWDLKVQQVVCNAAWTNKVSTYPPHRGARYWLGWKVSARAFLHWSGVHEIIRQVVFFFLQSPVLSVSVFIFCYQFIWNKVKSAHRWFHNASPSNHVYNTKNLSETEIERPGLHISVKYFESPLCMKCALKPPYLLIRKMIYCQSFHIAFQSQFCICIQMLSYFQSQSSDGLLPVCYWFPHSQKALVQIPARIFLCGVCTSSSFAYVGFLLVFSLSKKKHVSLVN